MKNLRSLSAFLVLAAAPGCIVIPVGDLLRGPPLGEQVLEEGAGFFSKDKIAIIDIDGVITGSEGGSLLAPHGNVLSETVTQLEFARADDEVRAVVLRISSPGGEVTACDSLHREIRRFKAETKLPVIACITDLGASGGYYVAMAADEVYAQPTSTVGSIGVQLTSFNVAGLFEKLGVAVAPVKSAPFKDINSPFRAMAPEERAVLQKLIDDMQARFTEVVVQGRPRLDRARVLAVADGRVFSGPEAKSLGLVDEVGYLSDAIEKARLAAAIESPTVVRYTRIARQGANIYSGPVFGGAEASSGKGGLRIELSADLYKAPRFYYIWQPGI